MKIHVRTGVAAKAWQDGLLTVGGEPAIHADAVVALPQLKGPSLRGLPHDGAGYPGQVTRVRARFSNPGQFVWHCHIVEHEDNEMMRPYRIGPRQPGQPD
jgi:FtsP/CotA-like multicopper oxidase with cupredoxin domain